MKEIILVFTIMAGFLVAQAQCPVVYNVGGGGSVCQGQPGIAVTLSSSEVGVSYELRNNGISVPPLKSGTGGSLTWTRTVAGVCTIFATKSGCSQTITMNGSATVTVNAPPTVFAVLGPNGSVCAGSPPLSIGVNGASQTNTNYQLKLNGSNVGSQVTGTGSQWLWTNVTTAGTYTIVATNTSGCTSTMSGNATFNYTPLPTLFTVTGGGTICQGAAGIAVSLNGSETGVKYQLWNQSLFSEINGTGGPLNWPNITTAGTYTVKAVNLTTGCNQFMTGNATLIINPLPTSATVQGGGTVCPGDGISVFLSGKTDTGVNYQLKINGIDSGIPMAGTGTFAGLEWTNQTTGGTYTVYASNPTTGCSRQMTASATITVKPVPTQYTVGGGLSACTSGVPGEITLDGSQSGVNYMLKVNGDMIDQLQGSGNPLSWSGLTTDGTYTITGVLSGCAQAMTGNAIIIHNQPPISYGISGGGSYCAGDAGLNIMTDASETGVNYQLKVNGVDSGAPIAGTGNPITWSNQLVAGTYAVQATKATSGCTIQLPGSPTVSLNPSPIQYNVGGGGLNCIGGVTVSLSSSQFGFTYQLKINGVNNGAPLNGTGNSLSWSNQAISGTYTVVATSNMTGCVQLMNGNATVTSAAPLAYDLSAPSTYCFGTLGVTITLSSSQIGVAYQLVKNGINSGTTKNGTGSPLTWTNQEQGSYEVHATHITSGCNQTMNGFASVFMTSLPDLFTVGGQGTYCTGGSVVTLSGSQTGINYQLKKNGTDIGTQVGGTGGVLTWSNLAEGTYTVTATNASAGCMRVMTGDATLTINTLPFQYSVTGGGAICLGNSGVTVTLSGSQTGVSYQLTVNGASSGLPVAGNGSALSWSSQTTAGTYGVTATHTTTLCSNIMNGSPVIIVNVPPSIISGPTHIGDNAITLVVNALAGYTYQWKRDSSDISSNGQSSSLNVVESGSYQVQATGNGCTKISDPYFVSKDAKRYFNGMIASARWRTDKPYGVTGADYQAMYTYDYDEKYQIREATWAIPDFALGTYAYGGNTFRVSDLKYDPNGNILSMRRYNNQGVRTHDFTYTYLANGNKLSSVSGYTSAYTYNAVGQMIAEDKEQVNADQYVEYDVAGKVRKVFSDAAKLNLKVEFQYDDRGFRMTKINYQTNKTTWYIRDGSGNVIDVYEQDGVPSQSNTNALVEIEVPIYGSGKLGTYYPQQEASVNYELTDHLGNVRAIVRDNINTLTATVEDNNQPDITNPRVEEMNYFQNLFETENTDAFMNVSKPIPTIVDNPEKEAYLFWNDNIGTQGSNKAIGPAISLKVRAGDKVNIESWTRYEDKLSFSKDFDLAVLSALLGGTFLTTPGFEGYAPADVTGNIQGALNAAAYSNDEEDNSRPYAHMNYILYDNNMVMQNAGWVRVPEEAGSDQSALYLPGNKPVHIQFEGPVNVMQDGYIYVWVSNQSKNTRVWFDNLTVTNTGAIVTQATDYGPWGDVIREQKTDESVYRFGYQGRFSEKDLETRWNHFELREYDAVIGRWFVPDPYRDNWSPYVAMNNNPVNIVDPRGGKGEPKPGDVNWEKNQIYGLNATTGEYEWTDFLPEVEVADAVNLGYDGAAVAEFSLSLDRAFLRGNYATYPKEIRPVNMNPVPGKTRYDCSGWVSYCLGTFYPELGKQFAASSDYIIKNVLPNHGGIRKSSPKLGDIAVWEGHFEFVVQVHGTAWSSHGSSGKNNSAQPTLKSFSSPTDAKLKLWGSDAPEGKFLGFVTPRMPIGKSR